MKDIADNKPVEVDMQDLAKTVAEIRDLKFILQEQTAVLTNIEALIRETVDEKVKTDVDGGDSSGHNAKIEEMEQTRDKSQQLVEGVLSQLGERWEHIFEMYGVDIGESK